MIVRNGSVVFSDRVEKKDIRLAAGKIAEIADKFTRNEVMTSNEIRQKIGMKPSSDPKADELRNSNLSAPAESTPASTPKEDNNQNGEET